MSRKIKAIICKCNEQARVSEIDRNQYPRNQEEPETCNKNDT